MRQRPLIMLSLFAYEPGIYRSRLSPTFYATMRACHSQEVTAVPLSTIPLTPGFMVVHGNRLEDLRRHPRLRGRNVRRLAPPGWPTHEDGVGRRASRRPA